nr:RHS repeat-associated core domain-containing protein [Flavobacterium sp. 7E]
MFEEHSSSFSSPHLFNGKELDRETNLSYYAARYLDMKTSLWLNVDPLAEKVPAYGAYVYTFNNPIRFTDPTGMIAEPPTGVDAEDGAVHSDVSGKWIYEKATTTWKGQNGAKDIGNTIELDNINIKGYKSNYVPSGEYGPYRPDGLGVTLSGSVDYNFTTYSVSFSLVADEKAKIGGFLTFGAGLSTSKVGAGVGASFDLIDTYGGATVFEGLKGYSKGGGASYSFLGGSHYQSAIYDKTTKGFIAPSQGVNTNSLLYNLKPTIGATIGILTTKQIF